MHTGSSQTVISCGIINKLYCSHSKQVQWLAKWYRQDISPPSVNDKIKTSGQTKPNGDTSYCHVCITFRVSRLA